MKKFLKELEINNVTDDVTNDIKHLNFKNYLKFYAFYGAIFIASVGTILGVREFISSDEFRKELIVKNNVAPLKTFFYNDFSSESLELEELLKNKDRELNTLKNSQSQIFNNSSYDYITFIEDLKAEKVKLNLDEAIKQMEVYKFYLTNYFTAYILQNKDKSITINNNKYTYLGLAEKVQFMSSEEALTQLIIPSKIIVDDLGLDNENQTFLEVMSLVLHNILKAKDNVFFNSLNLKDFSPKNGIKEIKENILSGKDIFAIKIFDDELKKDRAYSFRIDKLEKDYNNQLEIQKQEQEAKYKNYLDNKEKVDKKISKLNEDIKNIKIALNEIRKIKSDVVNYDINAEKIEKILDNVEGY